MQETRLKPLGSFFFLLAKAQRPVCGRQAQRNLTANNNIFSRLLVLGSCLSPLGSCLLVLFSFCAQRRRGAKKSNREQLYLGSWFLSLVSRFFLLFARKEI